MNIIEKTFNNKLFTMAVILIFMILIQEPSTRLFSSEVHYIGEALQKVLNYFPNQYSAYYQYESFISYRMIFDILATVIFNLTNDIVLTANFGRILVALFFTFSIYHLACSLNINLLTVIAVVSSFMLMNQQLVGGEKIFGNGFQSSALSYTFVILSISYYIRESTVKLFFSILFSIYLHFLIGGYWALFILLSILILEKKIKIFYQFLFFLILFCIPLLFTLIIDTFYSNNNIANISEIYAMRSKHHFLPFYSFRDFLWWMPGFFMVFCFICYGALSLKKNYDKKLNFLIVLCGFQIFISLIISAFDKSYFFVNFDPFRSSSVLLLITFFSLFKRLHVLNINFFIALTLIIPLSINVIYPSIGRIIFESPQNLKYGTANDKNDIFDYINKNTDLDDVIVNIDNSDLVELEIKTKRPTYYNWKLVPTKSNLLNEWNNRNKTLKSLSYLNCNSDKYKFINTLIVNNKNENFDRCGSILYNNNKYKIISLNN